MKKATAKQIDAIRRMSDLVYYPEKRKYNFKKMTIDEASKLIQELIPPTKEIQFDLIGVDAY